jgi:outer membrane protein OmpA-like peptidoglycan-associated protein
LDNLVAILSFPDAKIKIGGYTDKTGDEAKNLKLSADRANYIKAALETGVGSQVLEQTDMEVNLQSRCKASDARKSSTEKWL